MEAIFKRYQSTLDVLNNIDKAFVETVNEVFDVNADDSLVALEFCEMFNQQEAIVLHCYLKIYENMGSIINNQTSIVNQLFDFQNVISGVNDLSQDNMFSYNDLKGKKWLEPYWDTQMAVLPD